MTTLRRDELLRSDCFLVEIGGESVGGFTRLSGVGAAVDVFSYREGGFPGVRRFRDDVRHGTASLERGLARNSALWDWFVKGDLRDVAIVLLDGAGREAMRWHLEGAWPCSWGGPPLSAERSEVALERLEITYEGLRWQAS